MREPDQPLAVQPVTRRRFLHRSTTAVLGSALVHSLAVRAHAAGRDEIKIGLIGCGGRGTGAAVQALNTEGPVKLWAMADAFPEQVERSYKLLVEGGKFSRSPDAGPQEAKVDVPPERRFAGLDAFQKVVALDEVDAVLLTSPPGFRPAHFEAAARAGKHVFMEKPVATDAPGIRRVLAAAEEARRRNVKVGVGLNRRHSPVYDETMKRIHGGAIGRINSMRIYNVRGGTGKYHQRKPEETELEYQVRHWYYFTWLSGDFIVEQSVHDYDIAYWMKQMHPIRAQGQGGRLVRTGKDYGHIYDHFYVDYDYADGSKLLSQHRHVPGCWSQIGEFAEGTKGTASVVSKLRGSIQLYDQPKPLWQGRETGNSYQIEHDRLFAAIRNDQAFNEAEYGAVSTMMAILGRMAAYSGKMLTWDEALKSKITLTTDATSWDAPAPVNPDADGAYPVPLPGLSKVV